MPASVYAVEGPSGVGKGTVLEILQDRLASGGQRFSVVSNVDDSPFAKDIRALAKAQRHSLALCLLLAAARAYLRERHGSKILFDRYVLSSLVYQAFAGIDRAYIYALNAPLLAGVTTVYLRLDATALSERRASRAAREPDIFKRGLSIERELALFDMGVRFLEQRGHAVVSVDAHRDAVSVAETIAGLVKS